MNFDFMFFDFIFTKCTIGTMLTFMIFLHFMHSSVMIQHIIFAWKLFATYDALKRFRFMQFQMSPKGLLILHCFIKPFVANVTNKSFILTLSFIFSQIHFSSSFVKESLEVEYICQLHKSLWIHWYHCKISLKFD